MSGKLLIAAAVAGAMSIVPLHAQSYNKFAFGLGGGVNTPLNPTAAYTGVSGNFMMGAGYNINAKDSIIGEFMWNGLPPSIFILHPADSPTGHMSLYSLTANYRHQFDRIQGSVFGLYLVGGGGWYYRYATIDENYTLPPGSVCYPIYGWWGYPCDGGYTYSSKIAYKGSSAGGVNGGFGFTIRLSDSGWKFFTEARYHYAWTERVPTTLVPVTFGLRLN